MRAYVPPFAIAILSGIALASCSQTGGSSLAPGNLQGSSGSSSTAATVSQRSRGAKPDGNNGYKQLYSFKGGTTDGSLPSGSLLAVSGSLYGTTQGGGVATCLSGFGCGVVFKVSTSGAESVLYGFQGTPDGDVSTNASLVELKGELYGTTALGGTGACGSYGCGTIFKVSLSGTESVLHNFDSTDGSDPQAPLVSLNGKLYGTTIAGGTYGAGTVFEVNKSGKLRTVYNFTGDPDGGGPWAGLTVLNGVLYGTTHQGGATGSGAVFTVSPSGQESVLYSFQNNGSDGVTPLGGLTALNGTLYGTTIYGGANNTGTVFSITTSGTESIVTSDVNYPQGSLIAVNDALYGIASQGGAGNGIIFEVTPSGTFSTLWDFLGGKDGSYPVGGLTQVKGTLYGTTEGGGASGLGTVFKIKP